MLQIIHVFDKTNHILTLTVFVLSVILIELAMMHDLVVNVFHATSTPIELILLEQKELKKKREQVGNLKEFTLIVK